MKIVNGSKNHFSEYCRLISQTDDQHARREPDIYRIPQPVGRPIGYFESILGPEDEKALFFAESDGACLGFIQVSFRDIPDLPFLVSRKAAYINDLVVDEKAWGQEVARALMDKAVEWARARGLEEISLNVSSKNARAIAFYEKYGMKCLNQTMRMKFS